MNYERSFQLTAVALGGAAAFFLWRGNTDAMFVLAVLGAVAFFLSIRMQVKDRIAQRSSDGDTHSSAE